MTLTWREAWQRALYADDGFYRRDEGPAGHFATSAQGIPGVSEILAQAVLAFADRCEAEVIVDFASGRGELLNTIAQFDQSRVLIGVDIVDRPAGLNPRVTWQISPGGDAVPDLSELAGRRTLVVAHEWLDVVPCTIAEAGDDGQLREVLVNPGENGESLGDLLGAHDADWAARWWPDAEPGERVEIGLARDEAWLNLVDAVRRHAVAESLVLGIDYAHTADVRPRLGTLTGFRDGVECTPQLDGSTDITAHVAVDSLDTDAVTTQRDVLIDLFGEELLAPVPISLASSNPPEYLERLAVRSAFAASVARDGLGAFAWFWKQI